MKSGISSIRRGVSVCVVVKVVATRRRPLIGHERDAKGLLVVILRPCQVAVERIKAAVVGQALGAVMAQMPFAD